MMQEIPEGKWVASFKRVFTLNRIGTGTQVAIVSETQSRPVLGQLAALALYDLGAVYSTIVLPTPPAICPRSCEIHRGKRRGAGHPPCDRSP